MTARRNASRERWTRAAPSDAPTSTNAPALNPSRRPSRPRLLLLSRRRTAASTPPRSCPSRSSQSSEPEARTTSSASASASPTPAAQPTSTTMTSPTTRMRSSEIPFHQQPFRAPDDEDTARAGPRPAAQSAQRPLLPRLRKVRPRMRPAVL